MPITWKAIAKKPLSTFKRGRHFKQIVSDIQNKNIKKIIMRLNDDNYDKMDNNKGL